MSAGKLTHPDVTAEAVGAIRRAQGALDASDWKAKDGQFEDVSLAPEDLRTILSLLSMQEGGWRDERVRELPDFLTALYDEWGEEDHGVAAKQIIAFLADHEGLEIYRESYGLPPQSAGQDGGR